MGNSTVTTRPEPERSSLFPAVERRDLAAVERAANDVLRQIRYLRHNGPSDSLRWGLIASFAWDAWKVAAKADRRYARAQGWFPFRWRMPKGYAG